MKYFSEGSSLELHFCLGYRKKRLGGEEFLPSHVSTFHTAHLRHTPEMGNFSICLFVPGLYTPGEEPTTKKLGFLK